MHINEMMLHGYAPVGRNEDEYVIFSPNKLFVIFLNEYLVFLFTWIVKYVKCCCYFVILDALIRICSSL